MSADSAKPAKPPRGGSNPPFSPQDALAFMQKMWNPFGIPMPGFSGADPADVPGSVPSAAPGGTPFPNPAAMLFALDPAEVQRKIDELKVIESWLGMSLNMTQMSVKTLELQKASLEAMRSAHAPSKTESRKG